MAEKVASSKLLGKQKSPSVNSEVFIILNSFLIEFRYAKYKTTQVFFIVGCPRSGTTLLSVLLDRHPNICVMPETNFFNEIAPYLNGIDYSTLQNILDQWSRLKELNLNREKIFLRRNY